MSLFDPGIGEAKVFVFEQYAQKLSKWMETSHLGKSKPKLESTIRVVTKHFNEFNTPSSMFSAIKLTESYVQDVINDFDDGKGYVENSPRTRRVHIEAMGLDTLSGETRQIIEHFIQSDGTLSIKS
jgi:hypothetical protein